MAIYELSDLEEYVFKVAVSIAKSERQTIYKIRFQNRYMQIE